MMNSMRNKALYGTRSCIWPGMLPQQSVQRFDASQQGSSRFGGSVDFDDASVLRDVCVLFFIRPL
jgi:hypothetical protein